MVVKTSMVEAQSRLSIQLLAALQDARVLDSDEVVVTDWEAEADNGAEVAICAFVCMCVCVCVCGCEDVWMDVCDEGHLSNCALLVVC